MFHSRIARFAGVAVLASSASLGVFALSAPAGASTLSIKCTAMNGNAATTVTLTGCTGNTGGASMPFDPASLATGGTITWVNGLTTTVTETACTGEGCNPKADKLPDGSHMCAAGSTEYEVVGKVTADTTGSATVGGGTKTEACRDAGSNLSLEPGTKAKI